MGPDPKRELSAIIFPERVSHRSVARIHRADDNDMRLKGAGFCTIGKSVTVWGFSETLNMKHKPEDAEVIAKDWLIE